MITKKLKGALEIILRKILSVHKIDSLNQFRIPKIVQEDIHTQLGLYLTCTGTIKNVEILPQFICEKSGHFFKMNDDWNSIM